MIKPYSSLGAGMVFCHNCGVNLRSGPNFCPRCGASQRPDTYEQYPQRYPYPYSDQYHRSRLSFVSKILFILAGMFLLVQGLLLFGLIILGYPSIFIYFYIVAIIFCFIGFGFAEVAAYYTTKNRNYNAALGASITVLGCLIVNIFLLAINLWALILLILGIAFLYISKNEFSQYEYIDQHIYNEKQRY